MAWIAVDINNKEYIFVHKPLREKTGGLIDHANNWIEVPKGTSMLLTGKFMTKNDKPVKLKLLSKNPTCPECKSDKIKIYHYGECSDCGWEWDPHNPVSVDESVKLS